MVAVRYVVARLAPFVDYAPSHPESPLTDLQVIETRWWTWAGHRRDLPRYMFRYVDVVEEESEPFPTNGKAEKGETAHASSD